MIEVKVLGMAGDLGMFEACRFSTVAELRIMIRRSTQIAGCFRLFINETLLRDPNDQPLATLDSAEATVFAVGTQGSEVRDFRTLRDQCAAILACLTGPPG